MHLLVWLQLGVQFALQCGLLPAWRHAVFQTGWILPICHGEIPGTLKVHIHIYHICMRACVRACVCALCAHHTYICIAKS